MGTGTAHPSPPELPLSNQTRFKDGWEFPAGEILSGPGRPLADRFPEGWRRALGYSWAVPFEAGTLSSDTQTYEIRRHPIYERHGVRPGRAWTPGLTHQSCLSLRNAYGQP